MRVLITGCAGCPGSHLEVEGLYRLFQHGDSNPSNIGNPGEFTVRELAEMVIELTGTQWELVHRPLPVDDPKIHQPDISRARSMLGWEPRLDLREGIRRTIRYFANVIGVPVPEAVSQE